MGGWVSGWKVRGWEGGVGGWVDGEGGRWKEGGRGGRGEGGRRWCGRGVSE